VQRALRHPRQAERGRQTERARPKRARHAGRNAQAASRRGCARGKEAVHQAEPGGSTVEDAGRLTLFAPNARQPPSAQLRRRGHWPYQIPRTDRRQLIIKRALVKDVEVGQGGFARHPPRATGTLPHTVRVGSAVASGVAAPW